MEDDTTLETARALARLISRWCIDQDDLTGFYIGLCGGPAIRIVRVILYWPGDRESTVDYTVPITYPREESLYDSLDRLAAEARTIRPKGMPPG